ncbi:MAG: AraC family transcriptional regulator ligand-binding domain-containing protein [Steroidobacteraceae bacterium]
MMRRRVAGEHLISSEVLLGTLEAARSLGIAPDRSLRAVGLDSAVLQRPSTYVPWIAVARLFDLLAAEARCPHFGLLMLKREPPVNIGVFNRLLRVAPDLGTALQLTVEHLHVWNQAIRWRLQVDGNVVHFAREELRAERDSHRQIAYMGAGGAVLGIQSLVDRSWRPLAVSFTHERPRNVHPFAEFFQAPVRFGQDYTGFSLSIGDLERPVPTRDDVMLQVLVQHVQALHGGRTRDDVVAQARALIRRHLGSGPCRLVDVARLLELHPKALQRELARQGTSFSSILEDLRYQLATDYLKSTRMSLAEVAALVGLSEASALSRGLRLRRERAARRATD